MKISNEINARRWVRISEKVVSHLEGRCSIQLSYERTIVKFMIWEPDNCVLQGGRTKSRAQPAAAAPEKDWQKTQYSNLIRYVPSGTYYARLRVKGKLIRRNLKTDLTSVAKLRLADFEKHVALPLDHTFTQLLSTQSRQGHPERFKATTTFSRLSKNPR